MRGEVERRPAVRAALVHEGRVRVEQRPHARRVPGRGGFEHVEPDATGDEGLHHVVGAGIDREQGRSRSVGEPARGEAGIVADQGPHLPSVPGPDGGFELVDGGHARDRGPSLPRGRGS